MNRSFCLKLVAASGAVQNCMFLDKSCGTTWSEQANKFITEKIVNNKQLSPELKKALLAWIEECQKGIRSKGIQGAELRSQFFQPQLLHYFRVNRKSLSREMQLAIDSTTNAIENSFLHGKTAMQSAVNLLLPTKTEVVSPTDSDAAMAEAEIAALHAIGVASRWPFNPLASLFPDPPVVDVLNRVVTDRSMDALLDNVALVLFRNHPLCPASFGGDGTVFPQEQFFQQLTRQMPMRVLSFLMQHCVEYENEIIASLVEEDYFRVAAAKKWVKSDGFAAVATARTNFLLGSEEKNSVSVFHKERLLCEVMPTQRAGCHIGRQFVKKVDRGRKRWWADRIGGDVQQWRKYCFFSPLRAVPGPATSVSSPRVSSPSTSPSSSGPSTKPPTTPTAPRKQKKSAAKYGNSVIQSSSASVDEDEKEGVATAVDEEEMLLKDFELEEQEGSKSASEDGVGWQEQRSGDRLYAAQYPHHRHYPLRAEQTAVYL